eukprot:5732995-Pleurochrysis_carterae.AAC.3
MEGFVQYDKTNQARFSFTTASRASCETYTRVAYGVSTFTWNTNMPLLRKGPGVLEAEYTARACNATARAAHAQEKVSSRSEANAWRIVMLAM